MKQIIDDMGGGKPLEKVNFSEIADKTGGVIVGGIDEDGDRSVYVFLGEGEAPVFLPGWGEPYICKKCPSVQEALEERFYKIPYLFDSVEEALIWVCGGEVE